MRICSYCGKYFAIPRRDTAEFCSLTVGENGHTCREVGAVKHWAGKIDPGAFYAWSSTAKGKRDECAAGKITFEEFKEWLTQS